MSMTTVKDFCANADPVLTRHEMTVRKQQRYLQLVEELFDEHVRETKGREETRQKMRGGRPRNPERGAITAVAKRVGKSQSFISRLLYEGRNAGEDSIQVAMERLKLRGEFFTSDEKPRSYRDYVGRANEPANTAWKAFLRDHPNLPAHLREFCAAMPILEGHQPKDKAFYESALFAATSLLKPSEVEQSVPKNQTVRELAKQHK
jgi:hypothetical protein